MKSIIVTFSILFSTWFLNAQTLDVSFTSKSTSLAKYSCTTGEKTDLKKDQTVHNIVINDKKLVIGEKEKKVVAIIQSQTNKNKFRIFYQEPAKYGEFTYTILHADWDASYKTLDTYGVGVQSYILTYEE